MLRSRPIIISVMQTFNHGITSLLVSTVRGTVQMDLAIHGLPRNGLTFVLADVSGRGNVERVDKLPSKLEGLFSYLRHPIGDTWAQVPGGNPLGCSTIDNGYTLKPHTQINSKDELVGLGDDLIEKHADMGGGIQIIGVGRYTTLLRLAVHPGREITSGKSINAANHAIFRIDGCHAQLLRCWFSFHRQSPQRRPMPGTCVV